MLGIYANIECPLGKTGPRHQKSVRRPRKRAWPQGWRPERKGYLVVVGEVIVGDGNGSGTHDGIDKSIGAVGQRAVVHPNVAGAENGNGIPVSHGSPSIVRRRAADHGIPGGLAAVDVEAMDDDVGDVLDGDAGAIGDVDVDTTSIDGLKAVHDEFFLERDLHVVVEGDPEGHVLDDGVSKCSRARIHGIIVPGVRHNVQLPVAATYRVTAKANATVSELFSVGMPIGVAPPAVVDRVA
ncbi:hypothetical protein BHM03_00002992 [Ensete ventricosum]|nr:hypothetical protein BHM03_00002992 [Ensete ventricosum]